MQASYHASTTTDQLKPKPKINKVDAFESKCYLPFTFAGTD